MLKKILKFSICLVVFLLFNSSVLHAFWVWTPTTKKWTNPKFDTKDTPKEQFELAKRCYDEKKFKRAIKEFRKLVKRFSTSFYASEAQFYVGNVFMDMKKYYEAYLEYQKTIEKYPGTNRINDILEKEIQIANHYFYKEPMIVAKIRIPKDYQYCIDIYGQIVKNAPYSPLADNAQFFLAESYKSEGKFDEAIKAYSKLVEKYPDSEFVIESKYKIALCGSYLSSGANTKDMVQTQKAIDDFEGFTKNHGDSIRAIEAKNEMSQLVEKKAKELYDIGLFYEKTKQYNASLIYYKEVNIKYASSKYASFAKDKIDKLTGFVCKN